MSSRSLLMVLQVLACLQSFTMANTGNVPEKYHCCFSFLTRPIPVRVITAYAVTDIRCAKPGVIFTKQDGHHVCANPQDMWVRHHMNKLDQRLFNSLNKPEGGLPEGHSELQPPLIHSDKDEPSSTTVVGLDQCCFSFRTRQIPVRVITAYEETDIRCTKPGVIFTLQDGRHMCADPQDKWVKHHMDRIEERLFNSPNKPTESSNP